jgi:two-component system chemotaxis response regulator CheB
VIVQHITRGFGQGFAHWLDSLTPLKVSIAQPQERLTPGHVLVAPDDLHMTILPGGIVQLDRSDPVNGQRPSATRLFESIAKVYGPAAIGVVLSGMGDDGAAGLQRVHEAGGYVLAQNEESCAVFSMPEAAIKRGIVDRILTPKDMASALLALDGYGKTSSG